MSLVTHCDRADKVLVEPARSTPGTTLGGKAQKRTPGYCSSADQESQPAGCAIFITALSLQTLMH